MGRFWQSLQFGNRIARAGLGNRKPSMSSPATAQRSKRQAGPLASIDARTQRAIDRIADSDCAVLIAGEHGVGKRSVAEQIHTQSRRYRAVYTEIDCAETSAQAMRAALSSNGTVYFSEVGDLSLVLQEQIIDSCFRAQSPCTSRLVFGTSRDLQACVKSWCMREDFYYFISAITINISPLRCRKLEILALADELLTRYSLQFDRPKPVLGKEILGFLMDHSWPENLPEFHTAIKTFVAIEDQSVSLPVLKAALHAVRSNGHRVPLLLKEATRAASAQIERRLIPQVLALTNGNRKRAAIELGISYKALLYKLKQIGAEYTPASNKDGVAL